MLPIDKTNAGRRVELIIRCNDKWTKLRPGDQGTYEYANILAGMTQHMINWDNGSHLILI